MRPSQYLFCYLLIVVSRKQSSFQLVSQHTSPNRLFLNDKNLHIGKPHLAVDRLIGLGTHYTQTMHLTGSSTDALRDAGAGKGWTRRQTALQSWNLPVFTGRWVICSSPQ